MKFTRKNVSALLEGVVPLRDVVAHQASYFGGTPHYFSSGVWINWYSGLRLCEDASYSEDCG
jgi:Mor family transcriptional regulator